MLRALRLLLLSVPVAGIAAPVPREDKKPVLYFPRTVGTKWVYDLGGSEKVEEITDVDEKDGNYVVTIGMLDEKGEMISQSKTKYLVSEKRVFVGKPFYLKETSFPHALLKVPVKPGDKWEFEIEEENFKHVTSIGAIEDVEVPAGKFRAVPVKSSQFKGRELDREKIIWYAPDVGEVKRVSRSTINETTKVLKSFTPGKK